MRDNKARFRIQDNSQASNWRKRSELDGIIDWRMPASSINNLIRALYHPYVGAEFLCGSKKVKVWESEVYNEVLSKSIIPGTILAINKKDLLIKTGDKSAIWIKNINANVKVGDYL